MLTRTATPALLVALALALPGLWSCADPAASGSGATTSGAAGTVELSADAITIDGRPVLLRGGTIQWFKLPPETWDDRLRRFKAAGFNTVDVYVAWRNHEPVEGQFDFTSFDLRRFLDLCAQHGLYVYLRPGPYITNEMDGGGVPAWVFAKTSKRTRDAVHADGTLNLRTNDRDYLDAVERYFGAVNEVVRPYLHTNGGPIVLYGIENEYNWFQTFFDLDKLAELPGGVERPADQVPDVSGYFTALRDIVRADGIDVPITTCPGDGTASATGDVAGIVPMPNVYAGLDHAEYTGWALLREMHDPAQHGGVYVNMPTGITETDRPATTMRRLVLGGMDAVLQFNTFGSHAEGRMNAVVLNGGAVNDVESLLATLRKMTDVGWGTAGTAFVRPAVGYFHNVLDYYGTVGPSGTLRESFADARRTNLFLDAFEPLIAGAGAPARTTDAWITAGIAGLDRRVRVRSGAVGTQDPDSTWRRISYWLPLDGGAALLGLYNDGAAPRVLGQRSLEAFGERFPRFSQLTVPVEASAAAAAGAGRTHEYTQLVPIRFPLGELTLAYSTSEILTFRTIGDERVLVVYGPAGTDGELRLDGAGVTVAAHDAGVIVHEQRDGQVTLGWRHGAPQSVVVVSAAGVRTRVLVLDTRAAGRTWIVERPVVGEILLVGPAYVDGASATGALDVELEPGAAEVSLTVFSAAPVALAGLSPAAAWDATTRLSRWTAAAGAPPAVTVDLHDGRGRADVAEAELGHPTAGWESLGDAPDELERHGIYEGHAWYRAEVVLDAAQAQHPGPLWIDSVSDFAALYVNGVYVLTLAPLGTEVSSGSADADYRFELPAGVLHAGRNEIALRVEIWGHGSFMWPRGRVRSIPVPGLGPVAIPGLRVSAPALGFDSVKGVIGRAHLGGVPVRAWRLRAGLGGDVEGWAAELDQPGWAEAHVPLLLAPGQVLWYRTRFRGDALPDPAAWFAPVVLSLQGQRSRATIYLNGRIIGRWLAPDANLRRGSWLRPTRDAWMNTSPDDFPVARQLLREGDNTLVVVLEDMSDASRGEPAGQLDALALRPARENRSAQGTSVSYVEAPLARFEVTVSSMP